MWGRRFRTSARAALAFVYLVAFLAPGASATGLPESVTISSTNTYEDVSITLDGSTLLHIQFDSFIACNEFDFATDLDPYLILFDDEGTEVTRDDDSNTNDQNCFGSKLHLTPEAGITSFGSLAIKSRQG